MGGAYDDVAFLANSANRVAVLEALEAGPRHRDELIAQVDVSRVTLSRILADLEDRRWVERAGQECWLTPLGAWVLEEFTDFLDVMATEHRLREVIPWFPSEEVPFDVRCLREATVCVPSSTNVWAHVQRGADCFRSARWARVLSSQTAPPIIEATAVAVAERGQVFEAVLTRKLVETILDDSTMGPQFVEILEAPTASVAVYDEPLPVVTFITDGTVGIPLTDDEDIARALILSDDETIYDWAETTFEHYRDRAAPLDRDVLAV